MIRSMTGYGRGKYEKAGREYTIDIKSVNHKYCDITVRLPYNIGYLEENIKKAIQNRIKRGKIDVSINFSNNSQIGKSVSINEELAKIYISELKQLSTNYEIKDDISTMQIAKLPDVLVVQNNKDEETIWNEMSIALEEALNRFLEMREYEGDRLKRDLQGRTKHVNRKIVEISNYSAGLISEYVVKLKKRIEELLQTETVIDDARIAQEVVIYADKSSVEEEITRFKSHISQIQNILDYTNYLLAGKKLDFILQEMNREINTIGSKANCLEITNLVIDIKTELEDIREQVQNIE